MSRLYSHINTAKTIINLYKGEMPFSAFLKIFFSKEKKYGSRDRRNISSLCYNYLRVGFAMQNVGTERMLTSLFLCTSEPSEILEKERPGLNDKIALPLAEKIRIANIDVENIFPFNEELSQGIDAKALDISFLIQPKLFIRIRPGKTSIVREKLLAAQIAFEEIDKTCFAFANGTKLEEVLEINCEAVIQDYNSQRVGEMMVAAKKDQPIDVWDSCAASGGKSIMANDILANSRLTVSDVRESIIKNLHKRFRDAGIRNYQSFVADLTSEKNLKSNFSNKKFAQAIKEI